MNSQRSKAPSPEEEAPIPEDVASVFRMQVGPTVVLIAHIPLVKPVLHSTPFAEMDDL